MQQSDERQRKPYEKPEVVRVHVDPVTDLLTHNQKNETNIPRCGVDPTHYGT